MVLSGIFSHWAKKGHHLMLGTPELQEDLTCTSWVLAMPDSCPIEAAAPYAVCSRFGNEGDGGWGKEVWVIISLSSDLPLHVTLATEIPSTKEKWLFELLKAASGFSSIVLILQLDSSLIWCWTGTSCPPNKIRFDYRIRLYDHRNNHTCFYRQALKCPNVNFQSVSL